MRWDGTGRDGIFLASHLAFALGACMGREQNSCIYGVCLIVGFFCWRNLFFSYSDFFTARGYGWFIGRDVGICTWGIYSWVGGGGLAPCYICIDLAGGMTEL